MDSSTVGTIIMGAVIGAIPAMTVLLKSRCIYQTDAPAFRITKFTLLGLPPNYGVRHFCLFILYFWRKHTWRPPKGL